MGIRDDTLAGARGVSGIRSLLYGRAARRRLRGTMVALLEPGAELGRCRLERAKFKPGRKLTGYFVAEVRRGGRRQVRPIEVTWAAGGGADDGGLTSAEEAAEAEARAAGTLAPFSSLGAAGEGPLGAVVRVWPLDVAFPQLGRLATPRHAQRLLAEALRGSPLAPEHTVTSVRYRPRQRHVLRYDPLGEDGEGSVFAKLYPVGDAVRASRVAGSVASLVERAPAGVAAARPLPGSEADDVLLYPRVPGMPLSAVLWHSSAAARLVDAGRVLRALHRDQDPPVDDLDRHDFGGELQSIARAAEHLEPLLPTVAARVSRILDDARALEAMLPAEPPGFAHGDFKTDHLWVARDRLTVLDFDTCCLAEPALDVGKLLADLSFWYSVAGRAGVDGAQAQFLSGYGDLSAQRLARARLYEAVVLTKLTIRRLRRFDPGWEHGTEQLTARAAALLEAAAPGRGRRAASARAAAAPA